MKSSDLTLPPGVSGALKKMKERGDRRLPFLKKLVQSRDQVAMWWDLGRAVSDTGDRWIYDFVSVVESASDLPKNLPPYVRLSSANARDLLRRIRRKYSEIVRLHRKYGLDFRILDASGRTLDLESHFQRYADAAERALIGHGLVAKRGKTYRGVLFILRLATYLKAMHGRRKSSLPLSRIIAAAANGVFDTSYSPSDVTHILRRRRPASSQRPH
jgi:hypothetical protein